MQKLPGWRMKIQLAFVATLISVLITPSPFLAASRRNEFRVTKMVWKAKKDRLIVMGTGGGKKQIVTIMDAETNVILGETKSKKSGKWKFNRKGIDAMPCMVLAQRHDGDGTSSTYTRRVPETCKNMDPPVDGSHAGRFSTFEGTKTCLKCHREEALEVHGSVHYRWKGNATETIGLDTYQAGKLGGINDFCIYPDINWIGKLTNTNGQPVDGGCAKCHVGLGAKPTSQTTQAQLENIDCLICHSDQYKRTVKRVDNRFQFVADEQSMSVSLLQAALNVHEPSKASCLNCHTKAGGGNNFKRGDIEEAHRNPTKNFDVHMASRQKGGAGLSCLDCHESDGHKIAGRGTDLRPRELDEKMSCTNCHASAPHDKKKIDKHTARLDCTVCHIPVFAKAAATDMNRNWRRPGELVTATGLYEPHIQKRSDVIPVYRFFNGLSYFYQFGDPAVPGENGRVVMSAPVGNIRDSGAKIHPFKHHLATQPADPSTGRLLPLKIGKFFESGEIDEAVKLGTEAVGWTYNDHTFYETERYMGLFHEVAPKAQALDCNNCHNGGSRLDFSALGYDPREKRNGKALCISCHDKEDDDNDEWNESERFKKVHEKHVADKKLNCIKCHFFTAAR